MPDTSRRSLLAGLSVAPVALAPALPAIASPNPDPELVALIDGWQAHRAVLQTATEAVWDAEDRRRDIAVPDAMFERERDTDLFDRTYAQRYDRQRCWYPPEGPGHRYLRSIAGLMERHGCHGKNAIERLGRAKEALEAIAAYSADRAIAERECGLDVAEAEEERLSRENREQIVAIVRMPARTIAGVLRKTILLAEFYPGGTDFESATQGLERRLANDPLDDAVAFGIARDLLALSREGLNA